MIDQYSGRFMRIGGHMSAEEKAVNRKRQRKRTTLAFMIAACTLLAVPFLLAFSAIHKVTHGALPTAHLPEDRATYHFLDESGRDIGVRGPDRRPVDVRSLPQYTINAFLAIEDRRFYSHDGVDAFSIARAAIHNYEAGRIVEGGSTITQQLVKNLYLTSERTYDRKVQEAIFAMRLENRASKTQILQSYLYTVYFGANAYGIEAAASTYFDKPASELSVAESAMLAGLIKAPSDYNPFRREEMARERARLVLNAMVREGYITRIEEELANYDLEQLSFAERPAEPNGYFLDLAAGRTGELADRDYYRIRTTLDRPYQLMAENAIRQVMTPDVRAQLNAHEAAMVVMRPNGEVIAVVGGTNYGASQFNRAVSAQRQPGSLFKAFVYAAALDKGWHPDDYIVDVPITLPVPDKRDEYYKPANYDNKYAGLVTTEQAFAKSANAAALRLQEWVGREQVISHARRAGLDAQPDPWPSLALGVFESNLLDITAAYASLVANRRIEPTVFKSRNPVQPAYGSVNRDLLKLMRASVTTGTSRSTAVDTPSFGKTGTTQDYRDAWYIGLTDKLIVGVWVGNDDNTPMKEVTGASLPGQIWKTFMEEAEPHLALETHAPTFASRPLADIVAEEPDQSLYALSTPRKRILGKARVNQDGTLNFYGRTYRVAGIDPDYFRPYTLLAQRLPDIANYREMMCEIRGYAAQCEINGRDLGTSIAASGWAPVTGDADSNLWYAERQARDQSKGIWANSYQYAAYRYSGPQDRGFESAAIAPVSGPEKYRETDHQPGYGPVPRVVGEAAPGTQPAVSAAAEIQNGAVIEGSNAIDETTGVTALN